MGFFVVASTMAVACACIFLGKKATSDNGRGLLASLMALLHTILSLSVLLHIILAANYSSQRELSIIHCCVDLSQIFAVQLVTTRIVVGEDEQQKEQLAVAMVLLFDSCNLIYVTLLGTWAWADSNIADGASPPV
jgi:hypothetical protein